MARSWLMRANAFLRRVAYEDCESKIEEVDAMAVATVKEEKRRWEREGER